MKTVHGNLYSSGFPDLTAYHRGHGHRLIEVKCPDHYSFTAAQLKDFPKFNAAGAGIWIMTAATQSEYACLFRPYNWQYYLLLLNQRGCNPIQGC